MTDLLCPVLIGRDDELDRLQARLERTSAGDGGVILVAGEPGVGKSRLLREVRRRALDAELRVLSGRAVDRPTSAFRPLSEALIAARSRGHGMDDVDADPFAPVLERLWGAGDPLEDGEVERLALGEAVVRFLTAVAQPEGCLLVLEDLHWADADTLAVIEYLGDHLPTTPVLCVGAVRTGEGGPAERWMRDLAGRRLADLVELRRLDDGHIETMARACLRDDDLPEALSSFLASRSEGLPLLVEELLAGLVSDDALVATGDGWEVKSRLVPRVPLTLIESVQRRIRTLGPPAADVVHAAAVLGRRFPWSLLPAVTGLPETEVTDALRRARDLQLVLVESDGEFRFRHALSRDAVLDDLLPPERARLAATALEAVEAAHPELEDDWRDLAADLAVHAGRRDRATDLLIETARSALARGAVSTAQAAIERARSLASDRHQLDLDEAAAHAAALAGEVDRALRLGRAALETPADRSPTRQARLRLVLARALLTAGRWSEASGEAAQAAALASEAGDRNLAATADAIGAQAAIAAGRIDDARALAEQAVASGEAGEAPAATCEALEVLGRIARLHDLGQAERCFERARAIAERHGLTLWQARALHELGTIDLFSTLRRDRLLEARKLAPPALLALVELHLCSIAQARWEADAAYEAARRCVDLSRRLGLVTLGMGLIHLATAAALARRPEAEIEAAVNEALEVAGDEIDVAAGVSGRARFMQALVRGDLTALRAHLDEAVEILAKEPATAFPFRGLWALLRTLDDEEGAVARARALESAGGGVPINRGTVRVAEAVEAGRSGRREEAEAIFDEGLAELAVAEGADAWRGLLRLLVGPDALTHGWGDGAAWLRTALFDFEALGLVELASACRAELRAAGQPVPRRGRGESEVPAELKTLGVTSREVDVLRLLTLRLSNRDIAERLSLSPRTVERHVANLLTKTGGADRHALARLIERTDLPPSSD